MASTKAHWDNIFSRTEDAKMGWYETDTSQTFRLLDKIPGLADATVFLPGAGTSVLIEDLIPLAGRLVLNDISAEALNRVKQKIPKGRDNISWLCQDIAQPFKKPVPKIDIWIDRAVLHFLTDETDIRGYFSNLASTLARGGHVVFAQFSLMGAPKCAGLTLHRYSAEKLSSRLGPSFTCISRFDHTYINPFGEPRPYIYTLFKREE